MDVVTTKEEVLGRIWDSIMLVKLLNIDYVFGFFSFFWWASLVGSVRDA